MNDADKLLETLRGLSGKVVTMASNTDAKGINWKDYARTMAEQFHELDKLMSNGADLPDAWDVPSLPL